MKFMSMPKVEVICLAQTLLLKTELHGWLPNTQPHCWKLKVCRALKNMGRASSKKFLLAEPVLVAAHFSGLSKLLISVECGPNVFICPFRCHQGNTAKVITILSFHFRTQSNRVCVGNG